MYANIRSINEQMKQRPRTMVSVDLDVENDTPEQFDSRKKWLEHIYEDK